MYKFAFFGHKRSQEVIKGHVKITRGQK